MEKVQFDKNGIKILPPQKRIRTPQHFGCWKVSYTQEQAEFKASTSHDIRGEYHAYQCKYGDHWHIGHQSQFKEEGPATT